MHSLLTLHFDKLFVFVMVLSRVAAMVMTAPIFGSRSIPWHIRTMIAVTLSILVAPLQWQAEIAIPVTFLECLIGLLINVLIGASLGLAVLILFSGLTVAGGLISQSSTAALAEPSVDDLSPSSPVPARILQIVALTIFVAIGGHRLLMMAVLDSFQALPAAGGMLPENIFQTITRLLSESFRMAIRVATPVIATLLTTTLLVGLASRVMPQLNSFTMGFTLNLWTTLLALLFSLAVIGYLFSDQIPSFISIWAQIF